MKKIRLVILTTSALVAITIAILYPLLKKQEKVFVIGEASYAVEYNKSWKEFLDKNTKNPSFYLTSFKFSDEKTTINLYRADSNAMKEWVEYVGSIQKETDGSLITFKHGSATVGQYNSDVWFVGSRECCESSLETMIKLNSAEDFIFVQMVTHDESSSDKNFQDLSKKFYEIINSIHQI